MVLELIYSKTYTKFEFKNRKSKFLNYSKNYYKNFNQFKNQKINKLKNFEHLIVKIILINLIIKT